MIDPHNCTNFSRSPSELWEFFIFSVFTAGKHSTQAARSTACLLRGWEHDPRGRIVSLRQQGRLLRRLRTCGIGQYRRLARCLTEALPLDLARCSLAELETVHGVGPKTARFFLLHSRPDQTYAVLDVHLLAHLRELGFPAPRQTPTSVRAYAKWEGVLLGLAERSGMTPAAYDLNIWRGRAAA